MSSEPPTAGAVIREPSPGEQRAHDHRTPAGEAEAASPNAPPVIQVRGLRMSYEGTDAVAGIDLDVVAGEVFAFLGPNGAGKTTTVEILEGFRRRSGGNVSVLGSDPALAGRDWRGRIGVVLQESEPESELTVEECVELYAGYYPKPRSVAETLELVGLTNRSAVRCGRLSGGQRRRLDVALALVGDPELVFLDEPTTGFDPAARRSAWDVVAGLRDLGKTIFLTTHYMDEAEYLADRIVVIVGGRIVAEGTPATIGGREVQNFTIRFTLPPGTSVADLPAEVATAVTGSNEMEVEARAANPLPLLGTLADWVAARQIDVEELSVFRPTLETVYLQLTEAATAARDGGAVAPHPGTPTPHDQPAQPPRPAVKPRPLARLVVHQIPFDLRIFLRNVQSVFSTIALPVLFLLILASIFSNDTVPVTGGTIKGSVYYVPSIMTLGVISAAFGNLAASVVAAREAGIYKRRRATPVPATVLIASRAAVAVATALAMTAVLLGIGWAVYGASVPSRTAPALALDVAVGALAFCCMGYALASVIDSADASVPVLQSLTLPLYFISGVFIVSDALPHWLLNIAAVFPVRHLATALLAAYNPHTPGTGVRWGDLAVIAAWGAGGLAVAVMRFSWLPKGD